MMSSGLTVVAPIGLQSVFTTSVSGTVIYCLRIAALIYKVICIND